MTFVWKGIDHIQVAAPKNSEEEARAFYGKLLGLPEIQKPENLLGRGGCWFQCGSQEIHVGIDEHFQAAKKAHPGLLVENLSQLKKHLQQQNIDVKTDAPIKGRSRIFINDPFGNRLEFLEMNE